MVLTPAQIDAFDSYSNAQIVKLLRRAMVQIAADPEASVEVMGRTWTVHNLSTLTTTIQEFQKLADADARAAESARAAGGGAGVVEFGQGTT
jgi:hypothetical protein